jgi:hypothetical protein
VWGVGALAVWAAFLAGEEVWAAATHCYVCGESFESKPTVGGKIPVYELRDLWAGRTREICSECWDAERRCSVCGLPAVKNYREVGDGRTVCEQHVRLVVFEETAARAILDEVRREMERAFARFTSFPSTNVEVRFVSQPHMDQMLNAPGFERQCPFLIGYTRSLPVRGAGWRHSIALLSALPRPELIGVYAHELAHAWASEHVEPERGLAQTAEEGFCELVARIVLEAMGETEAADRVLRNSYTQGQIHLFLEAYRAYDFQRILDWMERGRTAYLLRDDPDRIRDVQRVVRVLKEPIYPPPQGVRRGPEELLLRSVLGAGERRVALVNDTSLMVGDEARVLVGTNKVAVRCLEVGADFVVLHLVAEGTRIELQVQERAGDAEVR